MISAAKSLASKISDLLGFSLPEEGPLSDADEYMPDFMELLAQGIKGNASDVLERVKELTSGIEESMGSVSAMTLPQVQLAGAGGYAMTAGTAAAGATTNNNTDNRTSNISVTVNGYNAQNDDALAQMVADKINEMFEEDESVYK